MNCWNNPKIIAYSRKYNMKDEIVDNFLYEQNYLLSKKLYIP